MAQKQVCFWCLKPFDENETFDKEKDQMLFMGYTPCARCQEILNKGIHVMGVQNEPMMKDQPAISTDNDGKPLYPTGSMMAAPEEWVRDFLDRPEDEPLLKAVLEQRVMMLPSQIMDDILVQIEEMEKKQGSQLVEDQELIEKQQNGTAVTGSMADRIGED